MNINSKIYNPFRGKVYEKYRIMGVGDSLPPGYIFRCGTDGVDIIGLSSREVKKKIHLLGDNTGYLVGTVAADVTVVSKEGAATVTVPSANRVNVGVGTLWSLVLSNGSRYEHPTMTSATTAMMYDVSGNGRHLTLTSFTLATAVVESLTVGSDWLNQIGWTIAKNSLYPSEDFSAWSKGPLVNTVTKSGDITTITYISGTNYAFVRPASVNTVIGKYTGQLKFLAENCRYVGLNAFCTPSLWPTRNYTVVDTVDLKIVWAGDTVDIVALERDIDGWITLTFSHNCPSTGLKYFSFGPTDAGFDQSATLTGNEILRVRYAGWIQDTWINYFKTTTTAISAVAPSTTSGVTALNGITVEQNAWQIAARTKNISCWGDSHTEGSRWDIGKYPRLLAYNTPGRTVFNGGYGGQGGQYILDQMALYPEKYGDISVLWLCNNDIADSGDAAAIQANIMSLIAVAVARVTGAGGPYVVLTLFPNHLRVIGTFGGDLITAVNNAIISTYPNNHIDIRTLLQAYGDGSANDLADIANGLVPRSLRLAWDNVHLNHKGCSITANIVHGFIDSNIDPLSLQKTYLGGFGRAKYSLNTDNSWPAAPAIIERTGVDNAVYDADGVGKTMADTAAALAALATVEDNTYLFAGVKGAVLYDTDMSANMAKINKIIQSVNEFPYTLPFNLG